MGRETPPLLPCRSGRADRGRRKKGWSARSGALRLLRDQLELVGHSAELREANGRSSSAWPCCGGPSRWLRRCRYRRQSVCSGDPARHQIMISRSLGLNDPKRSLRSAKAFFILAPNPIASEAELNTVEEVLIPEGLRQELNRAPLHRLHRHRDVAVPGDEDDWETPCSPRRARAENQDRFAPAISRRGRGRWGRPADPT